MAEVGDVPVSHRLRMGVRWSRGELGGVEGAVLRRRGARDGGGWAVLAFDAGTIRMRLGSRE